MNGVNNDPFGLMPLWDALLVIYGAFAEICDRHGLRYYMTDGNALGAVRHHGFIPWDDDLDVSMPRQDYEKFLMIASVELPSYLKIVDFKNTPEFGMLFCKIQDSRSDMVQYLEQKVGRNLSNGVFIDEPVAKPSFSLTQSPLSSQSDPKNKTSRTWRTWREIYSRVLKLPPNTFVIVCLWILKIRPFPN